MSRSFAGALISSYLVVLSGCAEPEAARAECSRVSVSLQHVATLGADAGPYAPTALSRISLDRNGRHLVAPNYTPGTVAVYDSLGSLEEVWGKLGSGPGEFRRIVDIQVRKDDSVVIADAATSRITILDEAGDFGRTFQTAGPVRRAIPLNSDSLLVLAGRLPGSKQGPIQVYRSARTPDVAFPAGESEWDPQRAREIAATDSFVISARRTKYELTLFSRNGHVIRQLQPEAAWFHGFSGSPTFDIRGKQLSLLTEIVGYSSNIILTLSGRENPNAERYYTAFRDDPALATKPMSIAVEDSTIDYYLDVLDVSRGCSLATLRLKTGVYTGFAGPDRLISRRELIDGAAVVDLWDVRIVPQPRSQ